MDRSGLFLFYLLHFKNILGKQNWSNFVKQTNFILMTKTINLFCIVFFFLLTSGSVFGQELNGKEASSKIDGASRIWVKEGCSLPAFVSFEAGKEIPEAAFVSWLIKALNLNAETTLEDVSAEVDFRGDQHRRVMLALNGIPFFDAMLVLHTRQGMVYAFNGNIPEKVLIINTLSLNEASALQAALSHIGGERYKWQMPEEEALLKLQSGNPEATYFPAGSVKLYKPAGESAYRYVWVFNIYADKPLYRADVFVDAGTGEVLFENLIIHHADVPGTAVTKYSGNQTITTDSTATVYRLRETGRGNGIETYNMQQGTNYGSAVDFTDADNYWNNVNANFDEVATDAHWGSEMTYDYFWLKHNRKSIDNLGFKLLSYVHYDASYSNAFWDGQRMTYGDGNGSSMTPFTAIDITGHEITHGLTSFTADLTYQDESGALSEGYSDIFGCAVEFFAKPSLANWLMGENIGTTLRSLSNPKSKGLPNCYQGTYWYTGTGDNGGVHTNCGPLGYWFYLLSMGGSGTNDNGNPYSVTAITRDSAAAIAFRALTVYLTSSSNYADARYYSIQAAIDLFGPCSQKVASCTNAFYAIGIGTAYIPGVISDFSAPVTQFCAAPATVAFSNLSNNGLSFLWDFGNGITSTAVSPTYTYQNMGNYTVTLYVNGGSCGSDTLVKTNYISISSQNPCVYNVPQTGTLTKTECQGFLMDSGGSGDYQNNTDGRFIISPSGAMSVTLNFQMFDFEAGFDYLYVYDGPGITSPLIGKYDGTNLPNGGTITSTGGSVTLRQTTDQGLVRPGFVVGWVCNFPTAAPVANFTVSDTVSCDGSILFMDVSTNGPNNWLWDFGDGTTASTKIVNHTYQQSGIYTVKLVSTNAFGSDTIMKTNVVKVEIPWPDVASQAVCVSGVVNLFNTDSTTITKWYSSQTGATPIFTGWNFQTPLIQQSTTYWVEELVEKPVLTGGKLNNTGGGGYFTSSTKHYLVFDAARPFILKSVLVYAGSAGNRTIELQNSTGSVIKTITVSLTQGMNTVNLNFDVPGGSGLRLAGPAAPDLYRNDAGCSYPYLIGDIVTITGSSATTNPTGYYYFFYQWKIMDYPCISPRVPVNVFVSDTPPVADFTYIIQAADVTFTDATSYPGVTQWSFGDGVTSTVINPVHTYSALGNYPVQLKVNNGCGIDSVLKTVAITSLGIHDASTAMTLKVYPNPSKGNFTLEIPQELQKLNPEIAMFDLMGRRVPADVLPLSGTSLSISATGQPAGIYVLRLAWDKKALYLKVTLL
jgi:Zn-dependent metalloprotease